MAQCCLYKELDSLYRIKAISSHASIKYKNTLPDSSFTHRSRNWSFSLSLLLSLPLGSFTQPLYFGLVLTAVQRFCWSQLQVPRSFWHWTSMEWLDREGLPHLDGENDLCQLNKFYHGDQHHQVRGKYTLWIVTLRFNGGISALALPGVSAAASSTWFAASLVHLVLSAGKPGW